MKDFDSWNKEKKNLELFEQNEIVFHEREIWWCSLGLNIGDEQDGKNNLFERPVLVIKKFNNKICWVLPITSVVHEGIYYHTLEYKGMSSSVILSQIRLVSAKRFSRLIRKISIDQLEIICRKLSKFLIK